MATMTQATIPVDRYRARYVGRRVRFVAYGDDDPQPLTRGDEGKVSTVGVLHVTWDNGRTCGLIIGHDRFILVAAPS